MAQHLHDFIERMSTIYKERCVLMPQVMQAKVRQSGIIAQPCPYLVYRCKWLTTTAYERMVIFAAGSNVFKDGKRMVIEGNAPCFARLAVLRGYRPVSMLKIKVFPAGTQGFIETRSGDVQC